MTEHIVIWIKTREGITEQEAHELTANIYQKNSKNINWMETHHMANKEAFDMGKKAFHKVSQ